METVPETGSTSSDLLARLREGKALSEGAWLVADRQSAGHGRHGRSWSDGAGNFMGSTVVNIRTGDPPAASLALVAGLAVHSVVAEAVGQDRQIELKWPNDVLAGGAKLAGVLLEREGQWVVVGIGVNLAVAPQVPGRATASVAQLGGAIGRDAFAVRLADGFSQELARWRAAGQPAVIRRWLDLAHPVGTAMIVDVPGEGPIAGHFSGLDDDGALQLTLVDGTTRTIHAGEVQLSGEAS